MRHSFQITTHTNSFHFEWDNRIQGKPIPNTNECEYLMQPLLVWFIQPNTCIQQDRIHRVWVHVVSSTHCTLCIRIVIRILQWVHLKNMDSGSMFLDTVVGWVTSFSISTFCPLVALISIISSVNFVKPSSSTILKDRQFFTTDHKSFGLLRNIVFRLLSPNCIHVSVAFMFHQIWCAVLVHEHPATFFATNDILQKAASGPNFSKYLRSFALFSLKFVCPPLEPCDKLKEFCNQKFIILIKWFIARWLIKYD